MAGTHFLEIKKSTDFVNNLSLKIFVVFKKSVSLHVISRNRQFF